VLIIVSVYINLLNTMVAKILKFGNIKEETKASYFIFLLRELEDVRTFEWGI
jgi:hypothetical protein